MIRKPFIIQLVFSALIGYFAWGGSEMWLALAPCFVVVWAFSRNKIHAYFCALSYYLAASHGLIKGAGVFFGSPGKEEVSIVSGIAIWVLPNIILALPWALLWGKKYYYLRVSLIILSVSIPPIGLFGWANPITAAGVIFPGLGWPGLIATFILLILLCYMFQASKSLNISIGFLLILSVFCRINYKEQSHISGIVGINTKLCWIKSSEDEYEHNKLLIETVDEVLAAHKALKLILLPELVIGTWNNANKHLWEKINRKCKDLGITVFLGGRINLNQREYISGMIAIGKEEGAILFDRVPVPISMWRPWAKGKSTAISYWSHPGVYSIQGKRVASIICYEQLLIWPILHSMVYNPEILLASSNTWWAKNTNIPSIQQQVTKAWAKLFNIQLVRAVNK
ncbi:hypothetical protein NF27_DT00350 [Candidatus Jidaibacter acanthamoeba]|uniref:CN hydrolase domain-containing protein n=1 Tax=Candidatus Jidaibacter acanthamoebae TaxID=86105 RepID=A0A0C1MZ34_9RICK|nr:nitrilase-related carbon-nitrogen hydrolase [Candidatus Jidaibacter acanthamoeba]KIE05261.1 hypothetical protein NF27_DT00350 [Candidatus Jidaibacter acanthamoeba]